MITIIGLGALGSHVALFLRNHTERLRLVDFDRVEMKNIQSQYHTRLGSTGANKSIALASNLVSCFGVQTEAYPRKVTYDNVEALLRSSKVVLDCTDNIEARRCIQSYVAEKGIPCLHGTLSADGRFGTAMWSDRFSPDPEGSGETHTCEDGDNLPFYAFVASTMAVIVTDFLKTGNKQSCHIGPATILRV